jgi:hypothetical protein
MLLLQGCPPSSPGHGGLALERLVFFSDAVIAIAITILVIDLRLPDTSARVTDRQLQPRLVAFVISVVVIGAYREAHHRMFRYITAFDAPLLKRNFLFLFFVALLPFLTSLLGQHGDLATATRSVGDGLRIGGAVEPRRPARARQQRRDAAAAPPPEVARFDRAARVLGVGAAGVRVSVGLGRSRGRCSFRRRACWPAACAPACERCQTRGALGPTITSHHPKCAAIRWSSSRVSIDECVWPSKGRQKAARGEAFSMCSTPSENPFPA